MSDRLKAIMAVTVSGVVLGVALFIIIMGHKYPAASTEWAYGTAGLVVGYWLK